MRLAAAAVVLFCSPTAMAQNVTDCGTAFPFRSFPQKLVEEVVTRMSSDPLNTVVGSATGRCEAGVVLTCVSSVRMNRNGYKDNLRHFYGVYDREAITFKVTATGAQAQKLCAERVIKRSADFR